MRVLHITGIPDSYGMEDISGLLGGLDVDSVFIELRKDNDFKFKGTVFMKPSTQEQHDALLEEKLKCEEKPLEIVPRSDFLRSVRPERRERTERKPRSENKEVYSDEERQDRSDRPKFQLERKERAVLHFTGASENTRYQEIKRTFAVHEKIAWVDYRNGNEEGYIRFMEDGAAERAIAGIKDENDGKLMVEDMEFEVRILEGDEDEEYWKKTENLIESKRRRNYFRSRGYNSERRYQRRRPFRPRRERRSSENDEKESHEKRHPEKSGATSD